MGKIDFNYGLRLTLRSLGKDDKDGNENGKKAIGFGLVERFSIECRKTKTKVITTAN